MNVPQSRRDRRAARIAPDGAGSDAPGTSPSPDPTQDAGAADGSVTTPAQGARPSRAGRNLPAAIGVGLGLGALIVGSLVLRKELMLVIIVVAIGVGVWELRRALAQVSINVPLVPSLVGSISMLISAYVGGGEALVVTVGLTCVGILLWRIADGVLDAVRDIAGGFFVAVYPSFLAGFAALMLATPHDGARRVFLFLLVAVLSDVGGYAAGVLFGKHPMAPSVSPKKSWEGFAGSVVACVVGGSIAVVLTLDGPWWGGALLGASAAIAATVGDLTESTIKRDLGIKDMGTLLPGHGGIMDRLDSVLLVAPLAWALLAWVVPPA
ncbi:phosphatidate cytidylyltransferase [Pedococcus bigeumensis]|uniref:Phosphatidate cytidylyltransferase n=1 Tax=Pedococcus bigeumensis TaxID=433644 RepID=A0A502CWP6_9MICO|nr:phosphatidate cytidylyltransferase [Pedococcus bigeumensis]TPG16236.1 phosphatidate cytidylyltransferase [Pedococcus bigeumensis]